MQGQEQAFLTALGAQVRHQRTLKGYSQLELSDMCGFEKTALSRIELGKTNPTALTLQKIAIALDIETGELFPKMEK